MSTRSKFQVLLDLFDAVDNAKKYGVELPDSVENALQNVQEQFDDVLKGNEIMIAWSIDDIECQHQNHYEYDGEWTEQDYRDILLNVERDHDASHGINWDVIESAIDFHMDRKENLDTE